MSKIVTRLYDTYHRASQTVLALRAHGFTEAEISLVGPEPVSAAGTDAGTGAEIGGVIGAGAGLLTGLGLMAIPGVGPVVAAGWLVATAAGAVAGAAVGAAAGGIVGALTGDGMPEADAHVYAEGVRRGGTLVTVRITDEREGDERGGDERGGDAREADARRIMDDLMPIDIAARGAEYRREGWEAFDPAAPPYTTPRGTTPMPPL